jgi:small subunit ribosomal protein S6
MQDTKRLYDTTFIVNASLEDSQVDVLATHVQEVITRNGGEILALNRWGRKRLAYTIQKKNNGFYINIEFSAPGATIPQLERAFQLDESVLRFLIIQVDKRAQKARLKAQQTLITETPVAPPVAEVVAEVKEPLFEDDAEQPAPAKVP